MSTGPMTRPRVLFLTHEATHTGAPIILHRFIAWLREQDRYDIEIVSLRRGGLAENFAKLAPTTLLETVVGSGMRQLQELLEALHAGRQVRWAQPAARIVGYGRSRHIRHRFPDLRDIDVIYANSVASAAMYEFFPRDRPPIVTHVHELGFSLDNLLPARAWTNAHADTAHFIACSHAVTNELERRGISRSAITHCPEPIVAHDCLTGFDRDAFRLGLGIPPGAFLVGGSGTRDWRKGVDLFVQLAARFRKRSPEVDARFIWIGGSGAPGVTAQLQYDAAGLDVDDIVTFVPHIAEPQGHFAALDVLAMTSREDPYPLVCVESALAGIPLVTFESGGAAELARSGAGEVVGYADIDAMADRIAALAHDEIRRAKLGATARERGLDHDIELLAPRLVDVIDRVIGR